MADDLVTYKIPGPDGKLYQIDGPPGKSREEVIAKIKEKQGKEFAPSEPDFMSEAARGLMTQAGGAAELLENVVPRVGEKAEAKPEGVKREAKIPQKSEGMTPGFVLGSAIGPAGLAGGAAKLASEAVPPMARSMIAGGVAGAIQPVGEGQDYWATKNKQIAEGIGLGYGFSVAGKVASKGIDAIGTWLMRGDPSVLENQAIAEVLKRIQTESKYGAPTATQALDLIRAANATGKPMALADVYGRNVKSLAGRAARTPGEPKAIAQSFLQGRDEEASQRLTKDIAKYVQSGPSMYQTSEMLLKARSAAAQPLYQQADALQGVWSDRLQGFLDNPDVRKGMARGYHIEQLTSLAENRPFDPTMLGVDLDEQGNIKLMRTPNMRVLDMGKQGLDAMIADHRDNITGRLDSLGRALEKVRKAYVSELDGLDKSGVYRKARETWAGYSAALDAVKAGHGAFSNTPEENAAALADMGPGNVEFARIGLADTLRERLGKAGFNSDESRSLIRNPWMRDQIKPFFKSTDDFNAFVDAVTDERTMAETKNAVLGGSQTAERVAEDTGEGVVPKIARTVRHVASGNVFGTVAEAWRMYRDSARKPDPEFEAHIAKVLFAPNVYQTDVGKRLISGLPEPIQGYLSGTTQNILMPAAAAGAATELPNQ